MPADRAPPLARPPAVPLGDRIVAAWYRPRLTPLALALTPLALAFGAVAAARRALYRLGVLASARVDVPVIVVGNLAVGGTGKTPLVRALARALRTRGFHPGIVSRGYGRHGTGVMEVERDGDAAVAGDEPLLLAADGTPVVVGADRVAAARQLVALHPQVDVILSDDGLQHYALGRDIEIVAVDRIRGFGNAQLLPAGPLREPLRRARGADALVWTGTDAGTAAARPAALAGVPSFAFRLVAQPLVPLRPGTPVPALRDLPAGTVHAVAGIASPERFFDLLRLQGVDPVPHAFADHHRFVAADFAWPGARVVLMTEKDAVKCRSFADERMFYLPLEGIVDAALLRLVEERLHGREAA